MLRKQANLADIISRTMAAIERITLVVFLGMLIGSINSLSNANSFLSSLPPSEETSAFILNYTNRSTTLLVTAIGAFVVLLVAHYVKEQITTICEDDQYRSSALSRDGLSEPVSHSK